MVYKYPKIKITEHQKIWLETVWDKSLNGEPLNYRKLKAELWGKIPNNFNPYNIDNRLLQGITEITLLGFLHLKISSNILQRCDQIIKAIRDHLLKKPDDTEINIEIISKKLKISQEKVSIALKLLSPLGNFYSGASHGPDTSYYTNFHIQRNDDFDQYINYESVEKLIDDFYKENAPKKDIKKLDKTDEVYINQFNPIFKSQIFNIDLKMCFVLMPFSKKWSNRIYEKLIRKNIEKLGLQCLRADELSGRIIIEDIWTKINQCSFIIADVTEVNPNVMYELGIAHTIGKPAILITQDLSKIPFDFKHHRHFEYQDRIGGNNKFEDSMSSAIREIYLEYYPDHKFNQN